MNPIPIPKIHPTSPIPHNATTLPSKTFITQPHMTGHRNYPKKMTTSNDSTQPTKTQPSSKKAPTSSTPATPPTGNKIQPSTPIPKIPNNTTHMTSSHNFNNTTSLRQCNSCQSTANSLQTCNRSSLYPANSATTTTHSWTVHNTNKTFNSSINSNANSSPNNNYGSACNPTIPTH